MTELLALSALATSLCLGACLTSILSVGTGTRNLAEYLAWSWILGVGATVLLLSTAGMLVPFKALPLTICGITGAFAVAMLIRRGRGSSTETYRFGSWHSSGVILIAVTFLVLGLASLQISRGNLTWDGLVTWEFRARAAFLQQEVIPLNLLQDPTRMWIHPGYPPVIPLMQVWLYSWVGQAHQGYAQWIFPPFMAAAAALLASTITSVTGRAWFGGPMGLMPLMLPDLVFGENFLARGYADLPLATLYLAVICGLLPEDQQPARITQPFLSAVALAICAGVKNEGALLIMAAVAVVVLRPGGGWFRRILRALGFVLPAVAVVVAWKLVLIQAESVSTPIFETPSVSGLLRNLPRLPVILSAFAEEAFSLESWSILWPLAVLALGYLYKERRSLAAALSLAIAVPLTLYMAIYLFTNCDLEWHLDHSADRLILHVAFIAILAIGLAAFRREPEQRLAGSRVE